MPRRKKFPNQIIVRREATGNEGGETCLQLYNAIEGAVEAANVGDEIEYAIYGLLETRTRRKT